MQQSEIIQAAGESGIHSQVRRYVQEHALYRQRVFPLAEDARYITAMTRFIEEEFGIRVSPPEITEENFGSLRAVSRFVASKQPLAAS